MRKSLIVSALLAIVIVVPVLAQDHGVPDSLIIGTVVVPQGAPSVMVPVYAVTDDSVARLNLPIQWSSSDNLINPGGVYFFNPLLQWDLITDTIDYSNHRIWIHGVHDMGGADNPVLNTANNRQQVMLIRMVIHSGASAQSVTLTPYTDPTHGSPYFGIEGVVNTFTPVIIGGGITFDPTAIDNETGTLPNDYTLEQNYPNPFNSRTEIKFAVKTKGNVSLDVYDLLGRHVKTLVSGNYNVGIYTSIWDGSDGQGQIVSSGIYFYSLKANGEQSSRKMVLLK
jgi:hypothetical protein